MFINFIMEDSVKEISLKIFMVGGYDDMLVIVITLEVDRICIDNK